VALGNSGTDFLSTTRNGKMIDDLAEQENRTRSELIREAIRRYIAEEKWAQIYRYAEQKALEKGISEDQIEEIIDAERE